MVTTSIRASRRPLRGVLVVLISCTLSLHLLLAVASSPGQPYCLNKHSQTCGGNLHHYLALSNDSHVTWLAAGTYGATTFLDYDGVRDLSSVEVEVWSWGCRVGVGVGCDDWGRA